MKMQIKFYRTKLLLNDFNNQFPLFSFKEITNGVAVNYSYSYDSPNIIHHIPNNEEYNSAVICIYKLIDPAYSPQKNNSGNCYLNVMIVIDKAYIAKVYGIDTPLFRNIKDSVDKNSILLQKKWLTISMNWLKNLEFFLFSSKIPDAYFKSWVFQYLFEISQETYFILYPNVKIDHRKSDILKVKKMEIILKNSALQSMPTIEDLSVSSGMSPTKLKRVFKEAFGKSTHQYILDIKADFAKKLLETNKMTVSQVAYKIGFNHPSGLTRLMKKKYAVSPLKILVND